MTDLYYFSNVKCEVMSKQLSTNNKYWWLQAKPILGELALIYTVSFGFFFMGLYRITLGISLNKRRKE